MITCVVGLPGSGKSYKALSYLVANFLKDEYRYDGKKDRFKEFKKYKLKNITHALVNINELHFDKFNNVKAFDYDELYANISLLYNVKMVQKQSDSEMIEEAKKIGLYEALILMDECHMHLDRQDKIIIWWLSYHRHLHQEVILLTQNVAIIHTKYKSFIEIYFKAIPNSLKLFSNVMKYNQYPSSRMTNNLKTGTEKLPIIKETFDLYGSGQNNKSKSLVQKFIIISIILFLLFVLIIRFATDTSSIEKEETPSKEVTPQNNITTQGLNKPPTMPFQEQENKVIVIVCSNTRNICTYNKKSFNKTLVDTMAKRFNYEVLDIIKIPSTSFSKYYMIVDNTFYYMFNEKPNNNNARTFDNSSFKNQNSN